MKDLSVIGEDLFNKIRGRFSNITIGNENGEITNVPEQARFFEFNYTETKNDLGKVSITISEDEGLVVLFNSSFVESENDITKQNWYRFLRELRHFAKRRLMTFDTRDIEKAELQKRDYQFLAKNRPGEQDMTESKMYGSSKKSYQKVGEAKIIIVHSQPITSEAVGSRTKNINKIYIESPEGERFRYPFKHLAGARAMARHVSEGGNVYDEFGKHVTGLSEEMSKLRKFKTYMNRSAVMAEGLSQYMDVVNGRIIEVRKRIANLQRESYYREAFESFELPVFEDVPEDIRNDWIAQLTVKQFNEELQDVFPYIYKLIGEAGPQTITPDDFTDESVMESDSEYTKSGMKRWQITYDTRGRRDQRTVYLAPPRLNIQQVAERFRAEHRDKGNLRLKFVGIQEDRFENEFSKLLDTIIENESPFNIGDLVRLSDPGSKPTNKIIGIKGNLVTTIDRMGVETDTSMERLYKVNVLKQRIEDEPGQGNIKYGRPWKDESNEKTLPKQPDISVTEYVLSMFDKENGSFPKGETAILTAVEKDYGEQFIDPMKDFIGRINELYGNNQSEEIVQMRRLAGM